jgi:putative transposase
MKKKRLTEEQVIGILRQAERGEQTIGEICRAQGVSEQSFYRWRRKFGGLQVST